MSVLPLLFMLLAGNCGAAHQVQRAAAPKPPPALAAAAADGPWPKARVLHGLETLWQVPPNTKGVLFVAHGCSHSGSDWWPPSHLCPHCLGLPEEIIVRRAALRRGYALVAVSSLNRTSGCWHNTGADRSEDLQRLPHVLRAVVEEEGLRRLPLYALGASSGGGIVLRLAQIMREIRGVVAQVVPARPELLRAEGRRYPPTLFVHMAERDPAWAEQITEALEHCRREGIPADEVRVPPRPVNPRFLQRSPLLSAATAKAAVAALRSTGLLDQDGLLVEDPRKNAERWRAALLPVLGPRLDAEPLTSHVAQLLNVAYAQHEISSDSAAASLEWLEAGGQLGVAQLVEQQRERRRRRHRRRQHGNRR